jgi:hypothetical protein
MFGKLLLVDKIPHFQVADVTSVVMVAMYKVIKAEVCLELKKKNKLK